MPEDKQDVMELTPTEVKREREVLLLEKERLELDKLRRDSYKARMDEERSAMMHETVEESFRIEHEKTAQLQRACNHMKGGPGERLLNQGAGYGDAAGNYAVITHTFNSGITFRMCQRCLKEWWPNDPEYKIAMSWPTKNSPSSGALLFGVMDREKIKTKSGQVVDQKEQRIRI
jgi:hypothetical protein